MSSSFKESAGFRMLEVLDDSDAVRVVLSGELDMAVAGMLGDRLRMLRTEGYAVRLDLAELEFIDSSGLRELVVALDQARRDGWRLTIDPHVTAAVRRTVDIAGLASYLWPAGG
jgi:anti-sigma B factor antagonist